ncbi:MAG: putative Alpha/beta hydrolase fold-3 domain protein (modular protein) [Frankiales bacterium]|nr:putative Alpha/beta hydrolase fold-3 domain protein (modular protein) [Frankiales bacterium]
MLYDLETYDASCRGLCNQTGAIVVSPDYRKAPEHVFPASHDDVLATWQWLVGHIGEHGGDQSRMAIGGESVGGTMAAADARPLNRPTVSWMALHAFEGVPGGAKDPWVDLLSVPGDQLAGFPPTLVLTAERDPLRSQGEEFAQHLVDAGVDAVGFRFDGTMHQFFGAAAVSEQGQRAQGAAADHLKQHLVTDRVIELDQKEAVR